MSKFVFLHLFDTYSKSAGKTGGTGGANYINLFSSHRLCALHTHPHSYSNKPIGGDDHFFSIFPLFSFFFYQNHTNVFDKFSILIVTESNFSILIEFCSSGFSKSTQGSRQPTNSIKSTFASFNFNASNLTRYIYKNYFYDHT